MKLREFNKTLNIICKNGDLDESKILLLSDETRGEMIKFIVRNRQPVLKSLIPEEYDLSWLASCGYFYESKGKYSGYVFLHTIEQKVR